MTLDRRHTSSIGKSKIIRKNLSDKLRNKKIYIFLWTLIFIIFLWLTFLSGSLVNRHNTFFGENNITIEYLNNDDPAFIAENFNLLVAIKDLHISVLNLKSGKVSVNDLTTKRIAIESVFSRIMDFKIYSNLGSDLKYAKGIFDIQSLIAKTKELELSYLSENDIESYISEAFNSWSSLNSEVIDKKIFARKSLQSEFAKYRETSTQGRFVLIMLAGLLVLVLFVLGYSYRSSRINSAARYKRFKILVASIGHELKSPLQAIQSSISLLRTDLSAKDRSNYSGMARNAIRSLSRLVTDILQIANGDELSQEKRPVNIGKWFYNFCKLYEKKAKSKSLQFETNSAVGSMLVNLDPERLTQCIGNLVENAIRYTKSGTISIELDVRHKARVGHDKVLIIKVKDTGVGIRKEDLSRIFLPFERASDIESHHGMGLGLSIVQKMAIGAGGNVSVESEVGVGSVFTFILPVEELPYTSVPWSEPGIKEVDLTTDSEVLIIDDDKDVCDIIKVILVNAGFNVCIAYTGSDAINLINANSFSIIISDIKMPGVDGYDICEACQKLPKRPYLIAMSAYSSELVNNPKMEYFNDVLKKPFSTEDLLSVIDRAEEANI
jgi:signal transduction histidine kinase/CheY-like chemotaxis protein